MDGVMAEKLKADTEFTTKIVKRLLDEIRESEIQRLEERFDHEVTKESKSERVELVSDNTLVCGKQDPRKDHQ